MPDLDCLALYADAEFYDEEFAARADDLEFYRRWALQSPGPVLELACGTGRITLPLARAGVDICGVDVSEPMLHRARQKAEQARLRVTWYLQDCRHFSIARKFGLIFLAANSLQHLHDLASLTALFARIREHLTDDGLLILDVFKPDVTKLSRPPAPYRFKEFTGSDGEQIVVEAASRYCDAEQLLQFDLFYRDASGRLLRTKHVSMRCFYPQELELLCRHHGFEISRRFGDYDEQPFAGGCPKQILVLRRAGT